MASIFIEVEAENVPDISRFESKGDQKGLFLRELSKLLSGVAGGIISEKPVTVRVSRTSDVDAAKATITCATGIDADLVTVNGTALTCKPRYNFSTIAFSTIVADNTITVDGTTFTAKASPDSSGLQFALGASDTVAMNNFIAAVEAYAKNDPIPGSAPRVAFSNGGDGTCTIREYSETGVAGVVTLAKNGAPITLGTLSSTKLTGGYLTASAQFPGAPYGNVAGEAGSLVAAALAKAINGHATLQGAVHASASAAVVTVYAIGPGTAGNSLTLAETGTCFTISGANLASGSAATLTFTC